MLATDKARALLAVGLSSDAIAELDGAIAAFRRLRLDQDLAQAELTLAQAALAAGALAAARRWAVAARRRFRRQGNAACAYLTELILLRSRFARVRAAAPAPSRRRPNCWPAGCAAAGWATTPTWPSCWRRGRWSRPGARPRRGGGSRPPGRRGADRIA